MIISCINCKKKFKVEDNLIPKSGRILQCGSCSHKWNFIPENEISFLLNEENTDLKNADKIENINKESETIKPLTAPITSTSSHKKKPIIKIKKNEPDSFEVKKLLKKDNISFFNFFFVFIVSSIAIIILFDTFKEPLLTIFPNIDLYLHNLYESLKDLYLFFKDLL